MGRVFGGAALMIAACSAIALGCGGSGNAGARAITCKEVRAGGQDAEVLARAVADEVRTLSYGKYSPGPSLARRQADEGCAAASPDLKAFVPTIDSVGAVLHVPGSTAMAWARQLRLEERP